MKGGPAPASSALPQRGDALGDVTVINVHRVDLYIALSRGGFITGQLLRQAQVIAERKNGLRVEPRSGQRSFVPHRRDLRLPFVYERQPQKCTALHGITEWSAAVNSLGNLLELADGFIQQAHLAVGDAEVVMGLEVFIFEAHLAELGAELVKHLAQRPERSAIRAGRRLRWGWR